MMTESESVRCCPASSKCSSLTGVESERNGLNYNSHQRHDTQVYSLYYLTVARWRYDSTLFYADSADRTCRFVCLFAVCPAELDGWNACLQLCCGCCWWWCVSCSTTKWPSVQTSASQQISRFRISQLALQHKPISPPLVASINTAVRAKDNIIIINYHLWHSAAAAVLLLYSIAVQCTVYCIP